MELTHYGSMSKPERTALVGKIVDLLIYDNEFCRDMEDLVRLKEEEGAIKSKILLDSGEVLQGVGKLEIIKKSG